MEFASPDCFNLASLCAVYGISADLLLDTEGHTTLEQTASRIEQLADEFIWTNSDRYAGGKSYDGMKTSHKDLGEDLLTLWKGIYFIEEGNPELQKRDKAQGSMRIKSDYGMKILDDDGVVAFIGNKLFEKLDDLSEKPYALLQMLCTEECVKLISVLAAHDRAVEKDALLAACGTPTARLNELLLTLSEAGVVEYVTKSAYYAATGYKLCGHRGVAAYLVAAALFALGKQAKYTVSEYFTNTIDPE